MKWNEMINERKQHDDDDERHDMRWKRDDVSDRDKSEIRGRGKKNRIRPVEIDCSVCFLFSVAGLRKRSIVS